MFKKLKIILIILILGVFSSGIVSAYNDKTTHPALTDEIVDFYNLWYPQAPITAEEKEWIIEGSTLEDILPRPVNHFYDPIYKVGWTGGGVPGISPTVAYKTVLFAALSGEPILSTVEWVNNSLIQQKYRLYGGERTWRKALDYYVNQNYPEAFKTLGHILHLLEDMAVPEHTRDDGHADLLGINDASPYEDYTARWNRNNLDIVRELKERGFQPIQKSSIEEYLKSLAEYSNKYFFSKDTINDPKYFRPIIIEGDDKFGYGIDENNIKFPLVNVKQKIDSINRITITDYYLPINDNNSNVFNAYFSRLSRQVVLHGAGVIHLFRKQVEDALVNKEFPRHVIIYDISKLNIPMISLVGEVYKIYNTLSSLITAIFTGGRQGSGSLVGSATQSLITSTPAAIENPLTIKVPSTQELSQEIVFLVSPSPTSVPTSSPFPALSSTPTSKTTSTLIPIPISTPIPIPTPTVSDRGSPQLNLVSTPTPTPAPTPTPIIEPTLLPKILISEIFYAEKGSDKGKEFIELYNPQDYEVDLKNWSLKLFKENATTSTSIAKIGKDDITKIKDRGYLLIGLNKYNPDNYNGKKADVWRTASLPQQSGIIYTIKLFAPTGEEVDAISYSYQKENEGKSLERKARVDSTIESMTIGEDRFSGNGYDSDSMYDFIVRDKPEPQNSESLPEPRERPPRVINILGEIKEDEKIVLSFELEKTTTNPITFQIKFATSSDAINEGNWNSLSSPSSTEIIFNSATNRFETTLLNFDLGTYYFAVKTTDKDGLNSDISEIYKFIIPFCSPHYLDVGNPYIKNIAFYSCFGKNWLDFTLYNFPTNFSSTCGWWLDCGLGFSFLLNKTENEICSGPDICFHDFGNRAKPALNVKGWGGTTWFQEERSDSTDSIFLVSVSTRLSDLDWVPGVPYDFHFEVAGYYDENGELKEPNFKEGDFIAPIVLKRDGIASYNAWFRITESQAKEFVLFEKNPRAPIPPQPKNFNIVFDERTRKLKFQFEVENNSPLNYLIRYRFNEPLNNINWRDSFSLAEGPIKNNGINVIEIDASNFETDKDYYFGLKICNQSRCSLISRATVFIPYPALNCAPYQNQTIFCENFENYEVGSILNQGDWRMEANNSPEQWLIVKNEGRGRSKALVGQRLYPYQQPTAVLQRNFPELVKKGGISFWVKRNSWQSMIILQIGDSIYLRTDDPSNPAANLSAIYLRDNYEFKLYPQGISPGVWQQWFISWNTDLREYKFKIDNNNWMVLHYDRFDPLTHLLLMVDGRNASFSFDNFQPHSE